MVRAVEDPLSRTFAALADPTRRAILARLARGSANVGDLAEPFDMSFAAVSKHLRVLESAGLVSRGRDAQYRPAMLDARPLATASAWIDDYRRFWNESLDALDDFLANTIRTRDDTARSAAEKSTPETATTQTETDETATETTTTTGTTTHSKTATGATTTGKNTTGTTTTSKTAAGATTTGKNTTGKPATATATATDHLEETP